MNNPTFIDHSDSNGIMGLVEVKLDKFEDHRGYNFEGYNKELYKACDFWPTLEFPVDSFSVSFHGTVRGFHGDEFNYKLIQCLIGEIQFFVIDLNPESATYKNVLEWTLKDRSPTQILIPPKCVNAHACLSGNCMFTYKLSQNYVNQQGQIHMHWSAPEFKDKVNWRVKNPVLSERDK
jgi:dTDP-4-dehydrorhamnose 3,5-epimerase-like enzyme